MSGRRELESMVGLVTCYAICSFGVWQRWPVLFCVAAALLIAIKDALVVDRVRFAVNASNEVFGLLLVAWIANNARNTATVSFFVLAWAGVLATRAARSSRRGRDGAIAAAVVQSANIAIDGSPHPGNRAVAPAASPSLLDVAVPLLLDTALLVAVVTSAPSRWEPMLVTCVIALGVAGFVIPREIVARRRARVEPWSTRRNDDLRDALARYGPEVIVYFSSPPTSTYALDVWLDTIEQFDLPVVLFVREVEHLVHILERGASSRPIVVVKDAETARHMITPSVRVVLYPSSVINNDDVLGLADLEHVLIGHGDSDKSVTFSPLHRAFDEIWVPGRAAVDRYERNGIGIRENQLRLVPRPQLAHLERRAEMPSPPYTVLYAPTWEGNFELSDYSSLAASGLAIVTALLQSELPITVLLKPHPATGQRSPAARSARLELEAVVARFGPPHQVVQPGQDALYRAFDESDVLITDVSSVAIDYLATRKPYLVTNPRGFDPILMRQEMLSVEGGYLLRPDVANLGDLIGEAVGLDSRAPRRQVLAEYFLGPDRGDPVTAFIEEVHHAVDAQTALLAASSAWQPDELEQPQ